MTYIDKDEALNLDFRINVSLFESRRKTAERAVQAYADAIRAIPAADVRPVVRCRDCGYSQPWYRDKRLCKLWHEDGIDVFNDGFCNYGKREVEHD